MKINLPVFKDDDTKDTITYQSWHWGLMVYHHAECQDHTLLPFAICSLQDYPGELVRSMGTDNTLDDVLTIMDEHYNNVKALDALNQELFQLQMSEKETVLDWGVHLSRHLQILVTSFSESFLLDHITELKCDCFYGGLPKQFKAMVAYLKASAGEKIISMQHKRLRRKRQWNHIVARMHDSTSKPKVMSFFHLWKLKGTQPTMSPAVQVAHLEEESTDKEEGAESKDSNGIKGITEEFIVHLARAVKDAQQEEKHCYHCSSLEHFIRDCPLVKASKMDLHLNQKEGMAPWKGVWVP